MVVGVILVVVLAHAEQLEHKHDSANPTPQYNGADCVGSDTQSCTTSPCRNLFCSPFFSCFLLSLLIVVVPFRSLLFFISLFVLDVCLIRLFLICVALLSD